MDVLTKAFSIHQELKILNTDRAEMALSLKVNFWAQVFFTIATWIIYLLFAASMYAAPLWVLQHFFGVNSGNVLAIIVLGVFIVVFPTALALGKHAGYNALSQRGVDIRYISLIVVFFIASGVYLEMTSASSQQQEKANQAVETSNAGKAIMDSSVTNASSGAIASLIADAEYKLVACERKLKEGKLKDCNNSSAKLASLKQQAQAERESVASANVAAISAKQSAIQAERDAQALPIAKMFKELLGSTIATGAIVAAFIAALVFEISHALTIFNEQRINRQRIAVNSLITETETRYFAETGKQYDGSDFKESEILDLAEMRKAGNIQHFNDRLSDVGDNMHTPNEAKPVRPNKQTFGFVPASRLPDDTPSATQPNTIRGQASTLKRSPTLAEIDLALSKQSATGDTTCPVCGALVIRKNIPNKRFCCKEHQKFHWKLKQKQANG